MPSGPTGRHKGNKESDNWCTQPELTWDLGYFDLDPCSNPNSTVIAGINLMLEHGDNGLTYDWAELSAFVNHPYSDPWPWCDKIFYHKGPFICLPKLDTTTKWWHRLMERLDVRWAPFKKRIKFVMPGKKRLTANFPSALVWGNRNLPQAVLEHDWLWPEIRMSTWTS